MRRLALTAFLIAAACGSPEEAAHSGECHGASDIVVSDAWTRPARSGQPVSAAYMTLCNAGDRDDALVGVTFAGAGAVEIHESSMQDGVMSMVKVDHIDLPAGKAVTLAPEGAHLMLIGVNEAITADELPVITLEFENADSVLFGFAVREEEMGGHEGHH